MSAETWQLLEKRAAEAKTGLEPFESFEPWFVALTLVVGSITQIGFDAKAGTEQVALAGSVDKQTLGLETVEAQISLFDELSAREQDEMLRGVLAGDPNSVVFLDAVSEAWRCGDAAGVEAAIQAEVDAHPLLTGFYEATFFRRNVGMAEGIREILQEKRSAFIVVGAGHLVGAQGIPALLEQAGFRVEQMRSEVR